MAYQKTKFTALIAGLCLVCCAAPLTALFFGGSALTGFGLFNESREMIIVTGVLAASVSAYLIWRRSRKNPICDLPKS
jgi:hypothetical protein